MLNIVLRSSIEGAVLVALVWILVRTVPRLSPSTRAMLWWFAAVKFVLTLIWTLPIEIAVLPAGTTIGATEVAPYATSATSSGAAVGRHFSGASVGATEVAPYGAKSTLLAVWSAGLLATFGLLAFRWRRTIAIVRRATRAPEHVQAAVAELARRLNLARVPDARISPNVDTPVVTGLLRPAVLLPVRFGGLPLRQQRMALCHELAHVARGDLWLGCAPALAERIFFFHPLVHLAAREYAFWREAACDAAVLDTLDATPQEYGRLLLDLGVASPRVSVAAAGASWSFSNLKRRISMLGLQSRASRSVTTRLAAAVAVLLVLGAWVPVRLVARPSVAPEPQATPVAGAEAPAKPSPAVGAKPSAKAAAKPQQAAAPKPSEAPKPAAEARQRSERDDARDLDYVLFRGGSDGENVHMSGSRQDIDRARSFRKGNESMLWFRNAAGEFVVRDPAILQQVEDVWKPVGELGAKQGQLGAEQGKLGARMGELGAKQGEIGAQQGRLGAKQAAIGAQQTVIGAKQAAIGASQAELAAKEWEASEAQRKEIDKGQRELDQQMRQLDEEMKKLNAPMRALDEEMRALGARMREFEKPMRDLSAEMEKLGGQMEKLGREMERESARAQDELRRLLDRAVASGAAQPVK